MFTLAESTTALFIAPGDSERTCFFLSVEMRRSLFHILSSFSDCLDCWKHLIRINPISSATQILPANQLFIKHGKKSNWSSEKMYAMWIDQSSFIKFRVCTRLGRRSMSHRYSFRTNQAIPNQSRAHDASFLSKHFHFLSLSLFYIFIEQKINLSKTKPNKELLCQKPGQTTSDSSSSSSPVWSKYTSECIDSNRKMA